MDQSARLQFNITSAALMKTISRNVHLLGKVIPCKFFFYKTKANNKKIFVTIILDGLLVFAGLLQMLQSVKK